MPVFKDCDIYWSGYDLSSTANEADIDGASNPVKVTTFGSGGNEQVIGGIENYSAQVMTFLDQSISGPAISGLAGTTDLLTMCPWPTNGTPVVGDAVYFGRALLQNYKEPIKVGDAAQINGSWNIAQGEGLLKGVVMFPLASVSATGTGSVNQTGAQPSPKLAYLGVHVTALSGDRTITVKLQSAAAVGFASPTDRITLSALGAIGTGFGSSSTATTDAYWRVSYTIGGTTGSVSFAAVMAIQ